MTLRHRSPALACAALLLATPLAAAALPSVAVWLPAAFPDHESCDPTLLGLAFGSPTRGLAVGSCFLLALTEDAGASWTRVGTRGAYGTLHDVHFRNATHAAAVGESAFFNGAAYVTTDGGASWTGKTFYFYKLDPIDAAGAAAVGYEGSLYDVHVLPDAILAVGGVYYGQGVVARSLDGGAHWSTPHWLGSTLRAVDFDADGLAGIAVGDAGDAWFTTDGGRSWHPGETGTGNVDLLDVALLAPGTAVAVGADAAEGAAGLVLRTTDGGATWTPTGAAPAPLLAVEFEDAWSGTATSRFGATYRTFDGGLTWLPEPTPAATDLTALAAGAEGPTLAGGIMSLVARTPVIG